MNEMANKRNTIGINWLALLVWLATWPVAAEPLATMTIQPANAQGEYVAEGVVEAVRSSVLAAQVMGSVTALAVQAGDRVKAGQWLIRVDTRLAQQQTATSQAQVAAANAELVTARSEYERKQLLYKKNYISQAALERAEADYKNAEAQVKARIAQSGYSAVETGLHTITVPYNGVVAEVQVERGSMVMPDKPLISMYDPSVMRVVASMPQSQLKQLKSNAPVSIVIGQESTPIVATRVTVLPMVDALSQMAKVRLDLPKGVTGITPGMFARARFATELSGDQQLQIPKKAVVRRSELIAAYVLGQDGKPRLRQIRLGRESGDQVEVLAGLQAGERLVINPQAALQVAR